jgi:predicted dehydrogenase
VNDPKPVPGPSVLGLPGNPGAPAAELPPETLPSRRDFLKTSVLAAGGAAVSAQSYARVAGANERVNVGVLGFGLIGRIHTRSFHGLKDARVAAVAETYQPRADACRELVGGDLKQYRDFRKLLDDKDLDAVIVATPDHWHALQTMMACAAGKDVYVEKPLHLFVKEGEWMQEVARKHKRVVQVGTQQRSAPHYQRAKELLLKGAIGEVTSVECDFFRNVMPGIGTPPDGEAPPELDWEMLLGPAPARRYNPNRGIYHFRWFWDMAGGQMTNLGHHSLDIVHWIFGLGAPKAVSSAGGRFYLKDNAETPDTQNAIIEYDNFSAVVQFREASAGGGATSMGALTFLGTRGTLTLSRGGFDILPDKKVAPVNSFAAIIGGHPVGGPQPIPEPKGQTWCEALQDRSGSADQQYILHAQNFIDCVKSRKTPNSDLASSHWVSTTCHLANISLRTGRKVAWDAAAGAILGDPGASAMLTRPYRAPWDKELKALLG